MRIAAGCTWGLGLLLATGCNQIFGLDPATRLDAAPDAAPSVGRLTYQLIERGKQTPPEYPALPAAEISAGLFEDAELTRLEYRADGTFEVPYRLASTVTPWRLVYQVPGQVTREIQWSKDPEGMKLVVPAYGSLSRAPVPPGSGYQLKPDDFAASDVDNGRSVRVYTTGSWTVGPAIADPVALTISYPFHSNARSLTGELWAPRADDQLVALAMGKSTSPMACDRTTGGGGFHSKLESPPAVPSQQPYWVEDLQTVGFNGIPDSSFTLLARLQAFPGASRVNLFQVGYVAREDLPLFTTPAIVGTGPFERWPRLISPVFLPILSCEFSPAASGTPSFDQRKDIEEKFARVLHFEASVQRQVAGGPMLTAGISVLAPYAPMWTPMHTAALIRDVTLGGAMVAPKSDGTTDRTPIMRGSAPLELTFTPDGAADYFEVVLHHISGTALIPQRVFVATQPSFKIVPELLMPGATYVLEIRAYDGRPRAKVGDFSTAQLPQTMTTFFTATFVVQ